MVKSKSSAISAGEGNTKPPLKQVSPVKKWCFTLNNWKEDELSAIVRDFEVLCDVAIVGAEIGESGTPHLQGYIELKVKGRPLSKFPLLKRAHWETAKGSRESNREYCAKDGEIKYLKGMLMKKPVKILKDEQLYPWQKEIVDLVRTEPNDRDIHWYWEATGNVGKTALCKKLCVEEGAVICSGKAADIKYSVLKYEEVNGDYPRLIIYDVPRTSLKYISFTGIEEVKGGVFMSSKYECGQCIMNSPHVLVFANEAPEDLDVVSHDRWHIKCLGDDGYEVDEIEKEEVMTSEVIEKGVEFPDNIIMEMRELRSGRLV